MFGFGKRLRREQAKLFYQNKEAGLFFQQLFEHQDFPKEIQTQGYKNEMAEALFFVENTAEIFRGPPIKDTNVTARMLSINKRMRQLYSMINIEKIQGQSFDEFFTPPSGWEACHRQFADEGRWPPF